MLCSCSGCSRKTTQGAKSLVKVTPGKSTTETAQPIRVTIYSWALMTGRVEVNMRDRKIDAVGHPESFRCSITAKEASELRKLIPDTGLRTLHPKKTWFEAAAKKAAKELREGYYSDCPGFVIRIEWSDKQAVFRTVPYPVFEYVPTEAKHGYDEIASIVEAVDALTYKYAKLAKPANASRKDLDRMSRELDQAAKEALPK